MKPRAALAALLLVLASGCAELHVAYTPSGRAPAPATGVLVQLRVDDARPPERGGGARVGELRKALRPTFDIEDVDLQVVTRTVAEATHDALGQAGVTLATGAPFLTATVREFWVDAHLGFRSAVTVEYTLWSADGTPRWRASLHGEASGYDMMRGWPSMTEETFQRALSDIAAQATVAFRSPGFVAAAQ